MRDACLLGVEGRLVMEGYAMTKKVYHLVPGSRAMRGLRGCCRGRSIRGKRWLHRLPPYNSTNDQGRMERERPVSE